MGVSQLGFLAFEVSDLQAWEAFMTQVLGLVVASRSDDGGFSLRMDGHAHRFFIEPGPADDLSGVGWEIEDDATLNALIVALQEAGVDVAEASPELCGARYVQRMVTFRDPGNGPIRLYVGAEMAKTAFVSPLVASGFVADQFGLGHLALSGDKEVMSAFYRDVLGFRLSDEITCEFFGHPVDLAFMHTNGRHHSVAFGGPQRKGLHHFMLEVENFDDVGHGYDRALSAQVPIANMLGRHPNDRMFSFYGVTPSGFQFELGWGGRVVSQTNWESAVYDRVSDWGHQPPQIFEPRKRRPKLETEGEAT